MLELEEGFEKAVNFVKNEFANMRAGRVSGSIVERVTVPYYGNSTPLKELATISNEDSRTILVNPWDISIRSEVCKAIAAANVGANPIDNGQYIRLIFPTLTEDRRRELVKQIKDIVEKSKVTMRNERRDTLDKIKRITKEEKFSEDDTKNIENDVQKVIDNYTASVEKLLEDIQNKFYQRAKEYPTD
jgi:ribosome recycling factor